MLPRLGASRRARRGREVMVAVLVAAIRVPLPSGVVVIAATLLRSVVGFAVIVGA